MHTLNSTQTMRNSLSAMKSDNSKNAVQPNHNTCVLHASSGDKNCPTTRVPLGTYLRDQSHQICLQYFTIIIITVHTSCVFISSFSALALLFEASTLEIASTESVSTLIVGPIKDKSTGRKIRPCAPPARTMPKNILKKTRNACEEEKPKGRMAKNVVQTPKKMG